jgi:hypothetical protein
VTYNHVQSVLLMHRVGIVGPIDQSWYNGPHNLTQRSTR